MKIDFQFSVKMLAGLAFLAVAGTSSARVVETFAGFNPTSLGTSTSSMGTATFTAPFGGTDFGIVNNASGKYPAATDNIFARYGGSTDQLINVNVGDLAGTGPVVQFAFAVKVNNLAAVQADNITEFFGLRDAGVGSGNAVFGLDVTNGALTSSVWNGFAETIDANAFVPGNPSNWNDGNWRVIAGRVVTDAAAGGVEIRVYNLGSGTPSTPVLTYTNPAPRVNSRVAVAVDNIDYGARNTVPNASRNILFDIDEFAIYPTTTYGTPTAFFSAVVTDYQLAPSSVSDWSMFN